jgi:hypothetical protein
LLAFTLHNIWQSRWNYIFTTLITLLLFSIYIFLDSWRGDTLLKSERASELLPKNSTAFYSGSESHFSSGQLHQFQNILQKSDSSIDTIFYQKLFSGIAQNGSRDGHFSGVSVQIKDHKDNFFQLKSGTFLEEANSSQALISSSMAEKLDVEINSSLNIYLLSRDEKRSINKLSLQVVGVFESDINIVVLSDTLSFVLLGETSVDRVVVKFRNLETLGEMEKEAEEIGVVAKKEDLEKTQPLPTMVLISLLAVATLLFFWNIRDLLFRRESDISALLNYNWSRRGVFLSLFLEETIFSLALFEVLIIFSLLFQLPIFIEIALFIALCFSVSTLSLLFFNWRWNLRK